MNNGKKQKDGYYYGDWTTMEIESSTNSHFMTLSVSLSPSGTGLAVGRAMKDDPTIGAVDYYQYYYKSSAEEDVFEWEHVGPILYDEESFLYGSKVALSSSSTDGKSTLVVGAVEEFANRISERNGHEAVYIYTLKFT